MEYAERLYVRSDGAVVDQHDHVRAEPGAPRPDAPLFRHPGSPRGRDFVMKGWRFTRLADGGVVMEREKVSKDRDQVVRARIVLSETFDATEWQAFEQVFVNATEAPVQLCPAVNPDARYLCVAPADHPAGQHQWRERGGA